MSSVASTLAHANLVATSAATALTIERVRAQANAKASKTPKGSKAPKASKGAKARKAPKAAQATDADQEASDAEGAEGAPATATPQGGGAEGALVTAAATVDAADAATADPMDVCTFVEGVGGRIESVTFPDGGGDGGAQPVTLTRPKSPGATPMLGRLWDLVDSGHRAHKRLRTVRETLGVPRAPSRTASPSADEDGGAAASPAVAVPARWLTRELPDANLRRHIEETYFIRIDDGSQDRHGYTYVPNEDEFGQLAFPSTSGTKRGPGSLCAMRSGKFPHAIVQTKMGLREKRKEAHYACYASHKIELVVRLWKHGTGGLVHKCSETELLGLIRKAYPVAERKDWGYLDDRMVLFLSLELASDTSSRATREPAHADMFKSRPENGFLLHPNESPPCTLNGGKPSFYEFEMERGVASIGFNVRSKCTSGNLQEHRKWGFFEFHVHAMNPNLVGLKGFEARSLPFRLKSVLHNDVNSHERYVDKDGVVTPSPPEDAR